MDWNQHLDTWKGRLPEVRFEPGNALSSDEVAELEHKHVTVPFLILVALALTGCAPSAATAPVEKSQKRAENPPAESVVEAKDSGAGPQFLNESFNQGELWITASTADGGAWEQPFSAAQKPLFQCFSDYEVFVEQCRGQAAQTKVMLQVSPRRDYHGPPTSGGHPNAFVALKSNPRDKCEDDYESTSSFADCVEQTMGEQLAPDFETIENLTLVFANVEPTMGTIGP